MRSNLKATFPIERVERKIYLLRGKKVMLGQDLAELYQVKNFVLNQTVKRNIKRFPCDFMFRLTEDETNCMVSQSVIPSRQSLGGYLPYAFTEHGALMLSSVLSSDKAIEIGLFIVRAFVRMRELISTHKGLMDKIEQMESKYDHQFKVVFDTIKALIDEPVKKKGKIGFVADIK